MNDWQVNCPKCNNPVLIDANMGSRKINCPHCEEIFRFNSDTGEILCDAYLEGNKTIAICKKCHAKNMVPADGKNKLITCGNCGDRFYLIGDPNKPKPFANQKTTNYAQQRNNTNQQQNNNNSAHKTVQNTDYKPTIKEKNLRELKYLRYKDGNEITLEGIRQAFEESADNYAIPIAFEYVNVQYGNFITGELHPGLVIYHPNHKNDYYKISIRIKMQGNIAFVLVDEFGKSTLTDNTVLRESFKETMKNGKNAERVGAIIGASVRRVVKGGPNKAKLEEEETWYTVINDMINEIIY